MRGAASKHLAEGLGAGGGAEQSEPGQQAERRRLPGIRIPMAGYYTLCFVP